MRFHLYGVEICNAMYTEYGGHWQKLSNLLNVDYLSIDLNSLLPEQLYLLYTGRFKFFFKHFFRRTSIRYDGWHHHVNCVIFFVSWGGPPYEETDLIEDTD